ncbi:trigger factor [soil metagenome]
MKTDLRAVSAVDYELEINADQSEIAPRLDRAIRKQRATLNLKGFRPGKVPLPMVRKMYGPSLAIQIAEEIVGDAYKEAVTEAGELDVLGQPKLTELDFDPEKDDDLRAIVQFGVRPEIDLSDFEGGEVTRFAKDFNDDDIEQAIQARRENAADLVDSEEGASAGERDVLTVDFQRLDADGVAVIGQRQEGARVFLGDPNLREELRKVLLGTKVGDERRADLPHEHGDDEGHDHDDHVDRFMVTVKELRHRELPELDEEFIRKDTGGEVDNLDDYRDRIRQEMERSWERRTRAALDEKMVEGVVAQIDVPVPAALADAFVDEMIEEVKQEVGGTLPDEFDEAAFRDENRNLAETRARWMLIKDQIIEDEGIQLKEEDFNAEFEKMADDNVSADMVKRYFMQQSQMFEQLGARLLNRRVFDALESRFTVVEKTRADLEAERAVAD